MSLRKACEVKKDADEINKSDVFNELDFVAQSINEEVANGGYYIKIDGVLHDENVKVLTDAGYRVSVTEISENREVQTIVFWNDTEQNETSVEDSEDESDDETWCLTPKGILYCALQEAGFVKSVPDERVDKAYEVFETLMKAGGYIEEEE